MMLVSGFLNFFFNFIFRFRIFFISIQQITEFCKVGLINIFFTEVSIFRLRNWFIRFGRFGSAFSFAICRMCKLFLIILCFIFIFIFFLAKKFPKLFHGLFNFSIRIAQILCLDAKWKVENSLLDVRSSILDICIRSLPL